MKVQMRMQSVTPRPAGWRHYLSGRVLSQILLIGFTGLALTGCGELKDKLIWSPDGSKLAVVAEDGLHIWSEEKLSPVLEKDEVQSLCWLSDSKEAVLTVSRHFADWQELLEVAGSRQKEQILASAEKIRRPLLDCHGDFDKLKAALPDWENLPQAPAAVTYLALHDTVELKKALGKHFKDLSGAAVEAVVSKRRLDGLEDRETVILRRLGGIADARLAGDGKYLLYCSYDALSEPETFDLYVVGTDAADHAGPQLIASQVGRSADWSADGLSLLYFQKSTSGFGSLMKMTVRAADGTLLGPDERNKSALCLADIKFNTANRVRSLNNDGAVMSAGEMRLPARADEPAVDNLFSVRQSGPINSLLSGLDRKELGESVSYFSLNPSRNAAVIATRDGRYFALDLLSGALKAMALPEKIRSVKSAGVMPSWKSDQELLFVADAAVGDKEEPVLVMWNVAKNSAELFSKNLPAKFVAGLQK